MSLDEINPETIKKKTFPNGTTTLTVKNTFANVNIGPTETTAIEVTIAGPQSLIEEIIMSETDGNVTIRGKGGGKSNTTTTRTQSGGDVITIQTGPNSYIGNINTNGTSSYSYNGTSYSYNSGECDTIIPDNNNGDNPEVTVSINIPVGTTLDLSNAGGKIIIGDTQSDLRASTFGIGYIHATSVKNLYSRVSGASNLYIENITGDEAFVQISGTGDVYIDKGQIGKLKVTTSGSGDTCILATTQEANLNVSGRGDIYLARCTHNYSQHISGVGKIAIGQTS